MRNTVAVCPGSFDPITVGHLDIITRAAGMFDKLIVVVMTNPNKSCLFSPEERADLIKKCVENLKNVEVETYGGLLANYVCEKNASVIIKGLRAMSDFEYEFQMALTNRKLNPNAETLFLTTKADYMYLSSSMVKQVASMGGDISEFIPEQIHGTIIKRINERADKYDN